MNFGQAIEALKNSKKVARKGWNGKGMFVYYVPAGNFKSYTEIGKSIADGDDLVHYNPYFAIKMLMTLFLHGFRQSMIA